MDAMLKPDLISEDRETSRLLIVEVKESIAEGDQDFFMSQLRLYADALGKPKTVYYVLVDGERIRFYKESEPKPQPLAEFNTRDTLRPYAGEAVSGRMSEFLLAGMTQAWLRDLTTHWKEQSPPGRGKLDEIPGLLDLLSKADVHVA